MTTRRQHGYRVEHTAFGDVLEPNGIRIDCAGIIQLKGNLSAAEAAIIEGGFRISNLGIRVRTYQRSPIGEAPMYTIAAPGIARDLSCSGGRDRGSINKAVLDDRIIEHIGSNASCNTYSAVFRCLGIPRTTVMHHRAFID